MGEAGEVVSVDGCIDAVLMHQADWLLALLHGNAVAATTDYNNALKVSHEDEVVLCFRGRNFCERVPAGRWLNCVT